MAIRSAVIDIIDGEHCVLVAASGWSSIGNARLPVPVCPACPMSLARSGDHHVSAQKSRSRCSQARATFVLKFIHDHSTILLELEARACTVYVSNTRLLCKQVPLW